MLVPFFFFVILILLLVIESTIISYPFVFILLFLMFMRYQTIGTLIVVMIVGSILDSLRVVSVGITPLFSFTLFFVLFLYTRKLDLRQTILVITACFFATLVYSHVTHYPINLLLHFVVFFALFVIAYIVHRKRSKESSPFVLFGK